MPTNGVCASATGQPTLFQAPVFDQPPLQIEVGSEVYLLASHVDRQLKQLENALIQAQQVLEQHEHALAILCGCPCA